MLSIPLGKPQVWVVQSAFRQADPDFVEPETYTIWGTLFQEKETSYFPLRQSEHTVRALPASWKGSVCHEGPQRFFPAQTSSACSPRDTRDLQ